MNPTFNQFSYVSALTKLAIVSIVILFSNFVAPTYAYSQATQLIASVDKNVALLDESFQLTITATGTASRDAIDFSVLQNNFRVSSPSFSQSTQIINGSMSRTVTWTVGLYPKQTGTFSIPSFSVDGQTSNEFLIRVLPVDTANSDQPREFYVTATIDNESIYLQQQISYTVKIHLSSDIQRGQLSLPELDGAIIEQLGEDEDYQEIIDGVRYRIIKRTYALIPQASGTVTIKGPIFEADVTTNSRRSFANFGRTKKIARSAPDLSITVRPIPGDYTETWLPSELVEIYEEWQGATEPFTVGEPVTRTITLTALGLTKEQLPTINMPYHPSFKVYPEQPNLATVERNNKLIAQGVFNSAIIPEQAGDFILPEARIPWFNVNTGETEYAILPARTVNVVANKTNIAVKPQLPVVTPQQSNQQTPQPTLTTPVSKDLNWVHYLLIASNVFTLIALYVVLITRKRTTTLKSSSIMPVVKKNESETFKHLKGLLEQGKFDGASKALEDWLRLLHGAQYYSISASLAAYPNSQALEHYNKILGNTFSGRQESIDFEQFIISLEKLRALSKSNNSQGPLNDLYPS